VTSAESGAIPTFAAELRAYRQRAGWTQVQLGDKIAFSGSFVSDVERCTRTPSLDFSKACDREFSTPGYDPANGSPGTFERLHINISREAYSPWFAPFVEFERRASRIINWDMRCFTGLLQTEAYARALIRAGRPDGSDAEVEADVATRLERQRRLDADHAPSVWFVIHEAVFRSAFGDETVMSGQVDHVAEMARRPRTVVQVYPFSASDCPGNQGAVTLFNFPDASPVGYAEGYEAGRPVESPQEVATLVAMFDHLRARALTPDESRKLIDGYRK
jgi:transcriptional regulator with XRE-family HTH domain